MKTTAKIFAMIFLLSLGTWMMPQNARADFGMSFQVFYDDLSPYGTWVDNPDYGFVWVPDVAPGFCPYATAGHWVYSVYGWTWVSDYSWGWAPFHYGRWYWDNWYGWVWVPGTDWGPGWVTWRSCDGYFGWAPLAPGFTFAMTWGWNINIPSSHWIFVSDRYFGRRDMDHFYINRHDNDRLYRRSILITNTERDPERNSRYFAGPAVKDVSRVTGRDFKPVEIRDNTRPGTSYRDGKLEMYRPEVKETASRTAKPAPENYRTWNSRSSRTAAPEMNNERSAKPAPEPAIRNERAPKPESTPVMRNDNSSRKAPEPVIKNERTPNARPESKPSYNRPPEPRQNQMNENRQQPNPGNARPQYQPKPVERNGGQTGRAPAPQHNNAKENGGQKRSTGENPHR